MGRPRTPTNILHLSGAFRKDPQRLAARANEPQPTGPIGDPPAWMDAETSRCWREIVAEAAPGVLTSSDRGILAVVAALRLHAERGSPVEHDGVTYIVIDPKKVALLVRCYTELGMTPASRSKVQAAPDVEKPQNAFAAV